MFCINCGTKVADEMRFCPNCGTKLRDIMDYMEKSGESQDIQVTTMKEVENKNNLVSTKEQVIENIFSDTQTSHIDFSYAP